MKTNQKTEAGELWTKAGMLLVAFMAGGCAVGYEEALDEVENDAVEQQWPGDPSATPGDVAVTAPDEARFTHKALEEPMHVQVDQVNLQPCAEVDAVCGGGEGICAEMQSGLYCIHWDDVR